MSHASEDSTHQSILESRKSPTRAGLRIVLIYAIFASLWILLSDTAVDWLISDAARRTTISMIKGWLFVAVTSLLLFGLIRRLLDHIQAASRSERQAQEDNLKSQVLLKSVVDSSPDAIFAKNLEGRYILTNQAVSYTHLRAHETDSYLVCRLLLEK